jgi:hypothetical protein
LIEIFRQEEAIVLKKLEQQAADRGRSVTAVARHSEGDGARVRESTPRPFIDIASFHLLA